MFSYYGSKWQAAPKYPAPEHGVIIEPFAGSAGYSLNYPDRDVYLIDADPNIVRLWEYLIHVDPEEILSLPLLSVGESLLDFDLTDDQMLFLGFWANAASPRPSNIKSKLEGTWKESFRTRVAKQVPYIRHWQVAHASYADLKNVDATWFVDPPYQKKGRYYSYSAIDYQHLGAWCRGRKGQVIACENAGAAWLPFTFAYNMKGQTHRKSTEVMWVK